MERYLLGLLLALSISIATCLSDDDYLLPKNTIPTRYRLNLNYLTEEKGIFNGQVFIDVNVVQETSRIILHAYALNIDNSTAVVKLNGKILQAIDSTSYDEDRQFYIISFRNSLKRGRYIIALKFVGTLSNYVSGFYRVSYTGANGQTRWVAGVSSTGEAARTVFPCFEEPTFRAPLTLSIAHPNKYNVLFSTKAVSVTPGKWRAKDFVKTIFDVTPNITLQSFGFVIAELKSISNRKGDLSIWSRPETIGDASFAMKETQNLLSALSNYTRVNHLTFLKGLNEVGLSDMLSWTTNVYGLPTFPEEYLLYKKGVVSTRDQRTVMTSISRAISWQWFGNLVTYTTYRWLWITEGLSTYFQYYGASLIRPDCRFMEQFGMDIVQNALLVDDAADGHAVTSSSTDKSADRFAVYDSITSDKGAALIHMMSHFLSAPILRTGIQNYLNKYRFKDVKENDLWSSIQQAIDSEKSGAQPYGSLKRVMDTWTLQKGFPLVTVTRDYKKKTITIKQEVYVGTGPGTSNETVKCGWWIPITYATQSSCQFESTTPTHWISPDKQTSQLTIDVADDEWIIFNVQQTALYRVMYDKKNWKMIADYLQTPNFKSIHPLNRAQLIDDALRMARSGYIDYEVALPMTKYLSQETDYLPWQVAIYIFNFLKAMFSRSKIYPDLKAYISCLVNPVHNRLGYNPKPSDDGLTPILRSIIAFWDCNTGDRKCVTEAERLLLQYYETKDDSLLPADQREWAYCIGLRNANESVWDFMWEKYLNSDTVADKYLLVTSLGCSQDEKLIRKLLKLWMTPDPRIRVQDRESIINTAQRGIPGGEDIVLDFLIKKFDDIAELYGPYAIGDYLLTLSYRLTLHEQLKKVKDFVNAHSEVFGAAGTSAVENVKQNIAWIDKYENVFGKWFKKNMPDE